MINKGWSKNHAGLYVPMSNVRQAARVNQLQQEPTHGSRQIRAAWLQALAAVPAAIIAIPGFWLALSSYQVQRDINFSQLSLNQLAQERHERRYSGRVAHWQNVRRDGTGRTFIIKLQNRAPVPLVGIVTAVRVTMGVDQRFLFVLQILVGSIPPCSLVTTTISEQALQLAAEDRKKFVLGANEASRSLSDDFARWVKVAVGSTVFTDPVGRWQIDERGLNKTNNPAFFISSSESAFLVIADMAKAGENETYRAIPTLVEDVGDCGEAD